MSHTKSHSHGSIPFSWEDKPGVCKILNNNECPLNKRSQKYLNKNLSSSSLSPQSPSHLDNTRKIIQGKKIPLPPPCRSQPPPPPPPRRSLSGKGFRWQEDPFLVAYKECTKSEKNNNDKLHGKNKKGVGSSFSERRSKFNFSCRSISDVRDDSYVKLSQLPRIHGVRNRSLTLEDDQKRGFNNYESWL